MKIDSLLIIFLTCSIVEMGRGVQWQFMGERVVFGQMGHKLSDASEKPQKRTDWRAEKMTSSDHRTRVTKMLIRRAFMDLLKVKPMQSISIKELCEAAGVNRGTFYAHYHSVYDLLKQLEDEMLREIDQALEGLLPPDGRGVSSLRISTELFQCLKDNADLCTVTLGEFGDKDFAVELLNRGRQKCVEAYLKYFEHATPRMIEYFYAFVSEGCIGLLRHWLRQGMTASAEEVAAMAEKLMLYGASSLEQR